MSVVAWGYGARGLLLTQGYGLGALELRQTWSVPLPAGAEVTLEEGAEPRIGSLEGGVAFGLDFGGWLDQQRSEVLTHASATVRADPLAPALPAYDATSSVLRGTVAAGTLVAVALWPAVAQTVYIITVAAQTNAGRTLECRLPRIWCPD